jgi:dihydrofolate synthase/folylpolyglutamate synthase
MRTYTEALTYLNRFISYERQQPSIYSPETLNLERVNALLDRLGRPDRTFRAIHVAGSKGKGSTSALIASCLRAAGYRTGLYTSPHLHTFRERMRVNGELISREDFARLVDEIAPHVEAVTGITWFEIITALAFRYFAQSHIDVGVIEVGLGGRFDATNVLTPLVSVITSLSMEHMNLLGNTLGQIAFEKAGIIKPHVPVVSAPQRPEAFDILRRVARFRATRVTLIGRDVHFNLLESSLDGQTFQIMPHPPTPSPEVTPTISGEGPGVRHYRIPLLGEHQVANAVTAITALRIANERGLSIVDEAIHTGLINVQWPGRLEILNRDPLLVVDGAHNGDSAQKLAAALRDVFHHDRWTLVIGISADKDLAAIFDALLPLAARVIVTRAHSVRAADVETLSQQVADRGVAPTVTVDAADALELAVAHHDPIIITGSLYTVADARIAWLKRSGAALPETDPF